MKLIAKVFIFALVCHLALGDTTNTTNTTNTTTPTTNTTTPTTPNTTNTTTPVVLKHCIDTQYWNGTGCSQCPANCGICVLKNKVPSCVTCLKENNYLQITNDIGSCGNCTGNCSSCRGPEPTDCLHLPEGFALNPTTKKIYECKQKDCQWCNADGTCGLCHFKFRLENGTCKACSVSGCAECAASASNCTKCMNGFVFGNNTCTACPAGCEHCANGTCTRCIPGKDMVGGKCVDHTCTAGCAYCDEKQVCTKCLPAFWLNSTGNGTCTACSGHCSECTQDGCTTCSPSSDENGFHYSLNNKTCNKCNDQNCLKCDGAGNCTTCYPGFTINDKKACTQCTTGCLTCTTDKGCSECRTGYKLLNAGVNATCKAFSSCKSGEAMDAAGNCTAGTIDNCDHGDAVAKTCITCSSGYYADGAACTPCPNGCVECSKNSTGYLTCTNVWSGAGWMVYHNNSKDAKVDGTGYLCRAGCATCTPQLNCTSCMPNLIFTQSLVHHNAKFCLPYEKCPHPVDGVFAVGCYSDDKNHTEAINTPAAGTNPDAKTGATKLAVAFVAIIAALCVF